MDLKGIIRTLKTSPALAPVLALIDLTLFMVDGLAILSTSRVKRRANSLLILRLDVLGDYLLFRNYLHTLRESDQFRPYTITLCANIALKSVAETFDGELIDGFIWTDIYKLSTRPLYRFRFVRQLRQHGFSIVFCPTYSRVLVLDDFLAWASGARERVGCRSDYVNIKPWEAWFGNRLYTRLLDTGPGLLFEGERNRRIAEALLNQPVAVSAPNLDASRMHSVSLPAQYVVFSLGAGQDFRVWPASRFAQTARFLHQNYPDYQILLTGAPTEKPYATAFLRELTDNAFVDDRTGRLSLPELVVVLKRAALLIANETGVVHIAASTQTPTIVVSQGKSLVRWHPYPAEIIPHIRHLYPAYIEQHRANLVAIAPEFNPESRFSIDEITVERVQQAIKAVLTPAPLLH